MDNRQKKKHGARREIDLQYEARPFAAQLIPPAIAKRAFVRCAQHDVCASANLRQLEESRRSLPAARV
jgi:hypothetical protein